MAELFAGLRKWRARQTRGNQVHAPICLEVYIRDVAADHIPGRAIDFEGLATMAINFDEGLMIEPGLFKSKGLPARASA